MKLYTFNVLNKAGEVVKSNLQACATTERNARAIADIKLSYRFPNTHTTLSLSLLGVRDTLDTYSFEHELKNIL